MYLKKLRYFFKARNKHEELSLGLDNITILTR